MNEKLAIREFFEREKENILKDLSELIAVKSRSVDRPECEKALDLVLEKARGMGFSTRLGKYHDVGIAEIGEGDETIGILAHVDVVPEGVRENWNTDPFELSNVDGRIVGRGVVDDKGPVIISLYAMKYLMECGVPLKKKIMLIVGTMEEIIWKDMEHFKEEFPLPDHGYSPDGLFPIYNRENGFIDTELIFYEEELTGSENISGGTASNSIPSHASCKINGVLNEYEGKNAHSSAPFMGLNAIALMCEDRAESEGYGFSGFMAKYFPEKAYSSNLSFKKLDGTAAGKDDLTMVPTMIRQEGKKVIININTRESYEIGTDEILRRLNDLKSVWGFEMNIIEALEPIQVDEDLPWMLRMKEVLKDYGISPECRHAGGCTYAKTIPNTVCFGPVFDDDHDCAHQDNEGQSLKNYLKSGEIYTAYLLREMR